MAANTQTINDLLVRGKAAAERIQGPAEAAVAWAALAQAAATFEVSVQLGECARHLHDIGRYIQQGAVVVTPMRINEPRRDGDRIEVPYGGGYSDRVTDHDIQVHLWKGLREADVRAAVNAAAVLALRRRERIDRGGSQ